MFFSALLKFSLLRMLCITEKKKAPAPPQHLATARAPCRLISKFFSDLQSELLILKSRTERKITRNPRPKIFVEIAAWEKTRSLVVEHEVMEQIVLQCRE